MAILPFDAEQRWSDGSDSLTSTDVSRKSRRKSDVTEDIVDENEGTGNVFCNGFVCLHGIFGIT